VTITGVRVAAVPCAAAGMVAFTAFAAAADVNPQQRCA
jgi:hypothetical protein